MSDTRNVPMTREQRDAISVCLGDTYDDARNVNQRLRGLRAAFDAAPDTPTETPTRPPFDWQPPRDGTTRMHCARCGPVGTVTGLDTWDCTDPDCPGILTPVAPTETALDTLVRAMEDSGTGFEIWNAHDGRWGFRTARVWVYGETIEEAAAAALAAIHKAADA